jgi:integrase
LTEKKYRPYESDPYIKRWLTGLSPKTKENYPNFFEDFTTFVGMSPTEIIKKRMNDLISPEITDRCFFEDKFRAFKESLEATGTNSDSKVHDRLKVASSFFTRNGLPLALKKGDWNSTQKQNVTEKKAKLSLDDVKRLYGHANLTEKCLLLILAQSGFSEIDIAGLKIQEIKGLYEMPINEHYVIEKPREKSNHVQATCLSYEFLHDLRQLLEEKGKPTDGYIFTSRTVNKGLKPIDTRRINEIIKGLYEKTFGIEKANEYQTRTLRSFYNSALLRAKIQPQEVKDLLMGHDREGARANYSYDDETIKQAYIQAFEFLSINGLQSREDLQKIKADMQALIGNQQIEIEQQKESMQELKAANSQQSAELEVMQSQQEDLEKTIEEQKKQFAEMVKAIKELQEQNKNQKKD